MAVYIIKSAQDKASIMNSSVGLLLTEEYFTVTVCYGSYKYAYTLRLFPVQCHRRGRGEERMRRGGGDYESRRGGGDYERRTGGEMKRRRYRGEEGKGRVGEEEGEKEGRRREVE